MVSWQMTKPRRLVFLDCNIRKERNRRIFERVSAAPTRVFQMIKEEMKRRRDACGGLELFF